MLLAPAPFHIHLDKAQPLMQQNPWRPPPPGRTKGWYWTAQSWSGSYWTSCQMLRRWWAQALGAATQCGWRWMRSPTRWVVQQGVWVQQGGACSRHVGAAEVYVQLGAAQAYFPAETATPRPAPPKPGHALHSLVP